LDWNTIGGLEQKGFDEAFVALVEKRKEEVLAVDLEYDEHQWPPSSGEACAEASRPQAQPGA
jgi:hypothetical protein